MTATIPTKEPERFVAGDTLKFTKWLSDYKPADSWVLTYSLVMTGNQISITATDNGDGSHLVNVAPTVTDDYVPGTYHWQAYVTKAPDRYEVDRGVIEIVANFANADQGLDARSHAEVMVDGLEDAIASGKDTTTISYSVSGGAGSRSRTFESRGEMIEALRYWRGRVRRERGIRRVRVQF